MFKLLSSFHSLQRPVVDVGLGSLHANEIAELFLGSIDKRGSWRWKEISLAHLDENGAGAFFIEERFSAGQKVRVIVKGEIQLESVV
jgi:hypothetical protein